jgi:hypothetical protein
MAFVPMAQVTAGGLECELVCKNRAGQIVGLNPQVKWMQDIAAKQAKK